MDVAVAKLQHGLVLVLVVERIKRLVDEIKGTVSRQEMALQALDVFENALRQDDSEIDSVEAMVHKASEYENRRGIQAMVIPQYEDFFYFLWAEKSTIKRRKRWLEIFNS